MPGLKCCIIHAIMGEYEFFPAIITDKPTLCCRMMCILGHDQYVWHTYCIRCMDTTDATRQPQEVSLIEILEMYLRHLAY